jgi:hypothetical protein
VKRACSVDDAEGSSDVAKLDAANSGQRQGCFDPVLVLRVLCGPTAASTREVAGVGAGGSKGVPLDNLQKDTIAELLGEREDEDDEDVAPDWQEYLPRLRLPDGWAAEFLDQLSSQVRRRCRRRRYRLKRRAG